MNTFIKLTDGKLINTSHISSIQPRSTVPVVGRLGRITYLPVPEYVVISLTNGEHHTIEESLSSFIKRLQKETNK